MIKMQYCRRCIRKRGAGIDWASTLSVDTCDSCKRENIEVFQAKEAGTFEEEVLEPELEIVAVVEEEAIPEMIKEVLEETPKVEPEPTEHLEAAKAAGERFEAEEAKKAEIEALKAQLTELEK